MTEDLWLDEEEQRILEYIKRTIPAEEMEHCLQVRKDIALRGAWSHRELDARLDRMQAEAQKVYEDNEPHNDPQQHTGGSGQQTSVEDIEHGEEPEAGNPDRQPQSGGYEPHNDPQQQSGGSEAPSAHAPKTAMQWLDDASRSLPHPLQLMPPKSMPVASIASRFPHPPKQAPPTSPPVTKAASSSPHPGTVGARSPAVASNYGRDVVGSTVFAGPAGRGRQHSSRRTSEVGLAAHFSRGQRVGVGSPVFAVQAGYGCSTDWDSVIHSFGRPIWSPAYFAHPFLSTDPCPTALGHVEPFTGLRKMI